MPGMATRVRDIVAELIEAGFMLKKGGKGSHRKYWHAKSGIIAIICRHDAEDAPAYLIKQIRAKISEATGSGE